MHRPPTVFEICGGGGGQFLGLAQAGFRHVAVLEVDATACATLEQNNEHTAARSSSRTLVACQDITQDSAGYLASAHRGVDLFAGGVPCPPFSIAGKQLGPDDERDLFPAALRLIEVIQPRAILLE